jgi:hypothetical protein
MTVGLLVGWCLVCLVVSVWGGGVVCRRAWRQNCRRRAPRAVSAGVLVFALVRRPVRGAKTGRGNVSRGRAPHL